MLLAADLFCGAGGLSLGFQQAGVKVGFANDINEDCATTYKANHDVAFLPGSIEHLTANQIFKSTSLKKGQIDVLIGGPPCQGFSINAPKRDEADIRNH